MAEGLGMPADYFDDALREVHTSYLRLNYYPPNPDPGNTLGISPHRDAGFLTVLWQDPNCHSLQVQRPAPPGSSLRYEGDPEGWTTVIPEEGGLTINTGDMAQIWSNNRYHAPLHRVLTNATLRRYSAPFFYNPGYRTRVAPLPSLGKPAFSPCSWGYFRAQRFAGDFADFGAEIQTDHFYEGSTSPHLQRQSEFESKVDFRVPFSVEEYRPLLQIS
uniref:Fe2OG dioxygenase domain-containing protein n=1 Tax=Haptolina ericina TaxID=156174 RepID=A0A6T9D389_9EUKA|mmetsp:Transcript_24816/g.56568  ORF Transcript_24816/g.56568 Transcript_24816/m.56568 type:complete len:217 (+) Transcript_24816:720-1370(+)